jgi:hypothetical protein
MYEYEELRTMQNNKKPTNTHLIVETSNSYLYFVDSSNTKVLLKTTDEGATITTVTTRTYDILSCYYDRTNEYIYFVDSDNISHVKVWYIDLSDDSITNFDTDPSNPLEIYDIFLLEGYVMVLYKESADFFLTCAKYDEGWSNIWYESATCDEASFVSVVEYIGDDKAYFLLDSGTFIRVFSTTVASRTQLEWVDGYGLPTSKSMRGIAYSGPLTNEILHFILKKNADSKHYWCIYNIDTDTITDTSAETDVALMLDRNCEGTTHPTKIEKAFHITNYKVFELAYNRGNLYLIDTPAVSSAIVAITDNYFITSNAKIWELTEKSINFQDAKVTHEIYKNSNAKITREDFLSTDRTIFIYDINDVLAFAGKLDYPKHSYSKGLYELNPKGLGENDLGREISYDGTAEDIATTFINMINDNSKFLYTDATATPATGSNISTGFVWDHQTLKDCLYTLCVLANGFFYVEPDGYTYFRKWSNMEKYGYYYGSPDNFNDQDVGDDQDAITWIDDYSLPNACTCSIIAELDDHKKVLAFYHDGSSSDPYIQHDYPAGGEISGTREFYWGTSDVTNELRVQFRGEASTRIYIKLHNGSYYYNDGAWHDTSIAAVNDQLDHHKFVWNCTSDTFDWYINSVLAVDGGSFYNASKTIDNIRIVNKTDAIYYNYLDAFGDPADSKYSADYNRSVLNEYNSPYPDAKKLQRQYNVWKIYGGINPATGEPFDKEETDGAHIQLYGRLRWGLHGERTQFPECRTQAALDAVATGLKNWQGMQDNPNDATFTLKKTDYLQIGEEYPYIFGADTNLPFTSLGTMCLIKNEFDLKSNESKITLSNNVTRRR